MRPSAWDALKHAPNLANGRDADQRDLVLGTSAAAGGLLLPDAPGAVAAAAEKAGQTE